MNFVNTFLTIAAIYLITVIISVLWKYVVLKYRLRHLKGPRGLPLLGNVLQLGKDNVAFLKQLGVWAEEYRDYGYYLLFLGTKPNLIVFNANDLETIVRDTKIDQKGFSYRFVRDWLGDGLALSEGEKWVSRRKLLTPSFHFSMLLNFLDVINEQAQQLSEKMCGLVDTPEVELVGILNLCSLDILNECMMGKKPGAQRGENKEYVEAIHGIGAIVMARIQRPWLWNDKIFRWSRLGKEYTKLLKTTHATTKKVIRNRKLEMQGSNHHTIDDKSQEVRKRRRLALLDLLIAAQKQDNALTDEDIQEEIDTFMFAGHDTVSASTVLALFMVGKYPEVQRKIQKELDEVTGNDRDRPLTMDDLQKLEYLGCVMKEVQRFMATVPFASREITSDVSVCGTVVPKGTSIILGFHWLHHDPKQFPDPQKFDPDRFFPANSEGRHHFAYLPFSAGHRNCIGQKFAIMEQKVIMATVLRKLEVTSRQTMEELRLTFELVLRPTAGALVKLNLRK